MIRNKSWSDGWLTSYWGRDQRSSLSKDLIFASPCHADGHLLYDMFCHAKSANGKTFKEELEARGYDVTTLQFSIKRKWKPNEAPK